MSINPDAMQLSVDIETMGLAHNAAILSIGLCMFKFNGEVCMSLEFYPSIGAQLRMGRSVDLSTIDWWRRQGAHATTAAFDRARVSVEHAVAQIAKATDGCEGVWGFGADFDCVKLQSLADDVKIQPWGYRKVRCGRTLVALAGEGFVWPDDAACAEQKHTAAYDARQQAKAYIEAYSLITGEKPKAAKRGAK